MNAIPIKIVKLTTGSVTIKLLDNDRHQEVPRRVFDKRLALGKYDVMNPSIFSSVI
ncbi:MAG: hypothetical protein AAF990_12370 [Bacteroidota bacterium]